jgi:hypothetical protein
MGQDETKTYSEGFQAIVNVGWGVIDGAEDEGWAAGDPEKAIEAARGKLNSLAHVPDPEARRCIIRQAASALVGALAHEAVVAAQDASTVTPAVALGAA